MKHAFLIMAHNNFEVLRLLLRSLDDERVDIYLHIDKKVEDKSIIREMKTIPQKAQITVFSKYKVFWGGASQIKTEMFLLKQAHKTYHDYYHLISGQDFLLKSIDEIDKYFSGHNGMELVHCDFPNEENMSRVMSYNFVRDLDMRRLPPLIKKLFYKSNSVINCVMHKLNFNRRKNPKGYQFYKGDNWFSITHNFAGYIIKQKAFIYNRFRFTTTTDEMFMQTVIMNSPYRDRVDQNIMRCIDWNRTNGLSPYTYTLADYEILKNSGKLFARKFSDADIEIVQRLYQDITE